MFVSLRSHHSMGMVSEDNDTALVDARFYIAKLGSADDGLSHRANCSIHCDHLTSASLEVGTRL